MGKTLADKIEAIKSKEKFRLLAKLKDAQGNYRDTGKDRYYKQITRIEQQLETIDCTKAVTVSEVNVLKDMHRKHLRDIKRRAEEFMMDEPLNIEFKHFCKWLDNYTEFIKREL